MDFFIDGIIQTAQRAIDTADEIMKIREEDMNKVQALGKTSAASGVTILTHLFKLPVVNVSTVQELTGFTRQGAHKIIERKYKSEIRSYIHL